MKILLLVLLLGGAIGTLSYWPAETALQLLQPPGLQWKQAHGRVWKGTAYQVSYAGQPLGDIGWKWRLHTSLSLDIAVSGATAQGQGHLLLKNRQLTIADLNLQLHTSEMQRLDQGLRLVQAQLVFADAQMVIGADGQCQSASGRVGTDFLQKTAAKLGLEGNAMNGELSCEEGWLTASMQDPEAKNHLLLSIAKESEEENLTVRALIKTNEKLLAQPLSLLGFKQEGNDYSYIYSIPGKNSATTDAQ